MYRLRHSSKIYSLVDYIVVNLYADIGVSLPPDPGVPEPESTP